MNRIFETAIAKVNEAYPSIFTKDDVVKLINDLKFAAERELAETSTINQDVIDRVRESLIEGVRNLSFSDFVELELGYDNQIEINFDDHQCAKEIESCFDQAVDEVTAKA